MRLITGTTEFETTEATAISLGKFDGLHMGHQLLVNRILKKKEEGLKALIFTFDFGNRPMLLLPGGAEEPSEKWGVDCLIECPFVESLAHMEAEDFVREILVKRAACEIPGRGYRFPFRP